MSLEGELLNESQVVNFTELCRLEIFFFWFVLLNTKQCLLLILNDKLQSCEQFRFFSFI